MNKKILIWLIVMFSLVVMVNAESRSVIYNQSNYDDNYATFNNIGVPDACNLINITKTVADVTNITYSILQHANTAAGNCWFTLRNATAAGSLFLGMPIIANSSVVACSTIGGLGVWFNASFSTGYLKPNYNYTFCYERDNWATGFIQSKILLAGDGYSKFFSRNAGTFVAYSPTVFIYGTNQSAPAAPPSSINLSIASPANNTQFNTNTLNFNLTANLTYSSNCSLYLNYTFNQSFNWSTGNNNFVNFTQSLYGGTWTYYINCYDNSTSINSSINTFYIDTVTPQLATNMINNSIFYKANITKYLNFSDDFILSSYNLSLDGWNIMSNASIAAPNLNITLNYNISNLTIGLHQFELKYADGHTANRIDHNGYYVDNGLIFNEALTYYFDYPYKEGFVSITNPEGSLLDVWDSEPLIDRFKFSYKPYYKSESYNLSITSDLELKIINHKDFGSWIIIGDEHWMDLVPYNIISMKQIDRNNIILTITNDQYVPPNKIIEVNELPNVLEFSSIGDLNIAYKNYTFYVTNTTEVYTTELAESQTTTLSSTINQNGTVISDITGYLNFSGTYYTATKISNTTHYSFSQNINIPTINSSILQIPHNWVFNITGVTTDASFNTELFNQTVYTLNLTNCSGTSGNQTLNFTIYDETTNQVANADIQALFNYGANASNLAKTLSFSLTSLNNTAVCMQPSWSTIYANYSIHYGSDLIYTFRNKGEPSATLTNTTQQVKLYLLPYSLSIYGRFNIVDGYNHPLAGVQGVMRDSVGNILETETSDASGLISFSVNPSTTYSFTFTLTGYPVYSTSLRIISSDILTIVLGTTITSNYNNSYASGITLSFDTSGNLQNSTVYPFNFNLTSNQWNITACDFYIYNGTSLLASVSGNYSSNMCTAGTNYNTSSYSSLKGVARYNLNGTQITQNYYYTIGYAYQGNFSMMTFLDDIKNFSKAGFNDFTRMLIALIIIIVITTLTIREGIKDPLTIGIIIFFLTLVFSYLGFFTISDPNIAIPNAWLRQYIISILVGLIASAYLIKQELY